MKRIISLMLIAVCLLAFVSCGPDNPHMQGIGSPNNYEAVYNRPEGFFTLAPEALRLEWDIKSIRNPYEENVNEENGDYSMPVYRFDTYDEYLHLCEIIGEKHVPTLTPEIYDDKYAIVFNDYRIGTFENYSLLLGWFTVETCHKVECYDIPENYEIDGRSLILSVPKHDCECTEDEMQPISAMIWVSVPKEDFERIDNISFVLEKCFSLNEQPGTEQPGTEQPGTEEPDTNQPEVE